MTTRSEVISAIKSLQSQRTQIRSNERQFNKQLSGLGQVSDSAQPQDKILAWLKSYMPDESIPTNIGDQVKALRPKFYIVDFTSQDASIFGVDPVLTPNSRYSKDFRVPGFNSSLWLLNSFIKYHFLSIPDYLPLQFLTIS